MQIKILATFGAKYFSWQQKIFGKKKICQMDFLNYICGYALTKCPFKFKVLIGV